METYKELYQQSYSNYIRSHSIGVEQQLLTDAYKLPGSPIAIKGFSRNFNDAFQINESSAQADMQKYLDNLQIAIQNLNSAEAFNKIMDEQLNDSASDTARLMQIISMFGEIQNNLQALNAKFPRLAGQNKNNWVETFLGLCNTAQKRLNSVSNYLQRYGTPSEGWIFIKDRAYKNTLDNLQKASEERAKSGKGGTPHIYYDLDELRKLYTGRMALTIGFLAEELSRRAALTSIYSALPSEQELVKMMTQAAKKTPTGVRGDISAFIKGVYSEKGIKLTKPQLKALQGKEGLVDWRIDISQNGANLTMKISQKQYIDAIGNSVNPSGWIKASEFQIQRYLAYMLGTGQIDADNTTQFWALLKASNSTQFSKSEIFGWATSSLKKAIIKDTFAAAAFGLNKGISDADTVTNLLVNGVLYSSKAVAVTIAQNAGTMIKMSANGPENWAGRLNKDAEHYNSGVWIPENHVYSVASRLAKIEFSLAALQKL